MAPSSPDMRLEINLASHPYEDSRQFWTYWGMGIGLLTLLTVLLLFLAVNGFIEGSKDRQQIARLRAQLAEVDQQRNQAQAMLNEPHNRVVRDRSRFLNDLFERKAFSWTLAFEQLEEVMPTHLHVISIHPGFSEESNLQLQLVVGGETREQALDLVRKMETSRHFKQTRIDSERFEAPGEQGGSDRVQFQITALYVPSGPPANGNGGMD